MSSGSDYDAVIVGASLAGCAAATLLGRAGARVALIEQRPDPAAFKRICSHFIQSSAIPTLERLRWLAPIEQAGGVRSRFRGWTRWGWIEPPEEPSVPPSVNLRRERLDPLIRSMTAETDGVELALGQTVDRVLSERGRAVGVETVKRGGERTTFRGSVVIGADGRDSRVAELAAVPSRTTPHGRFAYGGYYEGPAPAGAPNATVWFLDPDWAAAFPTDGGLTFYACMPTAERLEQFHGDPQRALERFVANLPEAPPIAASRLTSPVLGKLEMPNLKRGPIAPGLALIGDAALATDPLWGVGCGWALQSAEWLADSITPALQDEAPLDRGLRRYRRRFRRALGPQQRIIDSYARGRRLDPGERLVFSAAAHDDKVADLFEAFGTRNISPARFLGEAVPRALAVHARRFAGGRTPASTPAPENAPEGLGATGDSRPADGDLRGLPEPLPHAPGAEPPSAVLARLRRDER